MNRQTLIRKITFFLRGSISALLLKALRRNGFDPAKTILIFGSTRSGSTWLAELISSVSGHIQIFEPMNADYIKPARQIHIKRNMYLTKKDRWDKGKQYFEQVLSGKIISPWLCSQIPPKDVFNSDRLVVKFVRGNMLLDWLTSEMDLLPPVLVIRHPCATIASQLHKGWTPDKRVLLNNPFFEDYPQFIAPCSKLTGNAQISALAWCIRYFAPLIINKPHPFLLVSYEALVRNGERELSRLFNALGLTITTDIKAQLFKPSNTISNKSEIAKGKDPLAGWKNQLTETQISEILSVLTIFNMDFYTADLEPDYDKLTQFPAAGTYQHE